MDPREPRSSARSSGSSGPRSRHCSLIVAFGWGLLLLNGYGEAYAQPALREAAGETRVALSASCAGSPTSLVIAACVLATLRYFGFDPTAALAGLGIGGIAVALAAQKTLENVIGGLSIIFDKAVRVGDFLKLGETVGNRRLHRPPVDAHPHAGSNDPQRAERPDRQRRHRDRCRCATSSGFITSSVCATRRLRTRCASVIDGVQRLLASHSRVDRDSVRVRFFRLGTFSLDIEIIAYIFTDDFGSFLDMQQELLLRIMETVDASGTSIAFPSQTLHIAEGRLPDPHAEGISPGTAPSGASGGIRKPV